MTATVVDQLTLWRRPTQTIWVCPRCRYTTRQPARVRQVAHLCGLGQRAVALNRQDGQ